MTTTAAEPRPTTPDDDGPPSSGTSRIATIATGAARRWRVTVALLLVVLVAGGYAYIEGLDREGFPPINTPISIVTGFYGVNDAERVDTDVASVLEAGILEVDGVVATTTTSQPSTFAVFVEFEDDISSADGTQLLVDAGIVLPEEAQVDYRPLNAASFAGEYDILVSILGPEGVTPEELQAQAEALADALGADQAVEQAEVRDLLTTAPDPLTGQVQTRQTRFTRVALQETDGYRQAIAVGLVQADDSDLDVLEYADRVDALLADTPLEAGFEAQITADFATTVRQQLSSLTENLGTGLIAVAAVSLLLIGWRAAVMTALFMLIVMIGAITGLWTIGYTLNTITLFGLILTLGLLVDDAIVIGESIDANRDEPHDAEDDQALGAIRTALTRVGSASLAGTLTTVVVFSPLLFIGGILGEFIRPIPATVIVTLLLSFAFSIVFIPAAARFFLLRGGTGVNPIVRGLRVVARGAGQLAAMPTRGGARRLVGVGLVLFAVGAIGVGGQQAAELGFSIFPTGKDAVGLNVVAEFPPGTTIDDAQEIADELDDQLLDVLGDDLVRSQYIRGNQRTIEAIVNLTPIDARETTAPEFVEELQARADQIDGARIRVSQQENGPPVEQFPFAMQIEVDDATADAGAALASDIRSDLIGEEIEAGAETVTITDAIISTAGVVQRVSGQRVIEVRASYSDDGSLTSNLTTTQELVEARYGDDLAARGLPEAALAFDFGLESDNQEDFAALGVVGQIAILLMLTLLALQFRSVAQSLLIFLAIPFSFPGVFFLLRATDNPLSFLVVVGFIALIGVAVNNTILLVEAANRARAEGATAGEAIQDAVERRFRPLVATTITTVAGLLPLALSDPFWESLGFTLMGGLVSSTLLVLIAFPPFYLALEAVRTPVRNAVRRRRGRPLVP